ncbi:hypothetical protein CIPAW_03G228200 [Carya illinoinensis]|uniref:Uncharacterized protein n=1 Tax=Carya illinoinensis TaxID=32201 RepID=A0A8T1R6S9_CARIL|nr:hypothetical protein CIPAW_03G228200 [Carya illinoinensis]
MYHSKQLKNPFPSFSPQSQKARTDTYYKRSKIEIREQNQKKTKKERRSTRIDCQEENKSGKNLWSPSPIKKSFLHEPICMHFVEKLIERTRGCKPQCERKESTQMKLSLSLSLAVCVYYETQVRGARGNAEYSNSTLKVFLRQDFRPLEFLTIF